MTIYSSAWITRMSTELPKALFDHGVKKYAYITPEIAANIEVWENHTPKGQIPPLTARDLTEEEAAGWAPLIAPFRTSSEEESSQPPINYGLQRASYIVRLGSRFVQDSMEGDVRDALTHSKTSQIEHLNVEDSFVLEAGGAVAVGSVEKLCIPGHVACDVSLLPQYALYGLYFTAFSVEPGMSRPLEGIISNPTAHAVRLHVGQGFVAVQFAQLSDY